jgi:hypothetical protein
MTASVSSHNHIIISIDVGRELRCEAERREADHPRRGRTDRRLRETTGQGSAGRGVAGRDGPHLALRSAQKRDTADALFCSLPGLSLAVRNNCSTIKPPKLCTTKEISRCFNSSSDRSSASILLARSTSGTSSRATRLALNRVQRSKSQAPRYRQKASAARLRGAFPKMSKPSYWHAAGHEQTQRACPYPSA